jgi:CheY-like chemotaxis protein
MKDGKFLILCIDDDPDVIKALQMILEKNGYLVVSASEAEEGIKKFQETQPDLIIVDLMMEQIDAGTSFVTRLNTLGNKAPIYILSSVGDELSMTVDTERLGVVGVFQKPFEAKALIETLRTRLQRA